MRNLYITRFVVLTLAIIFALLYVGLSLTQAEEPETKDVTGLFLRTPVSRIVRPVPPLRLNPALTSTTQYGRAYTRTPLGDNMWLMENALLPKDVWIVKLRPRIVGHPDWRYYRIR